MLIEHYLFAQSFEGECCQDQEIRRITDLN